MVVLEAVDAHVCVTTSLILLLLSAEDTAVSASWPPLLDGLISLAQALLAHGAVLLQLLIIIMLAKYEHPHLLAWGILAPERLFTMAM